MGGNRKPQGDQAEQLACEWLQGQGYRIIERNYRTRTGELDIVAFDADVLCFIEVKALHDPPRDTCPELAVTPRKRGRVLRAAREYLVDRRIAPSACRFDVVGIVYREGVPELRLSKAAFDGSNLPAHLR